MIASNSVFAAARSMASMGQESILVVIVDNDNASGSRIQELAHLPEDAVETAWDEGTSITPISDEDADTLMDCILYNPDFFPAHTTLGLKIGLFFHDDALHDPDGVVGLHFVQDAGCERTVQHIYAREEQQV